MNTFWFILQIILLVLVVLIAYNLLKIFVFSKINVNKWIVLSAAIIVFISSVYLQGKILTPVVSGVFVILVLWFTDIMRMPKPKNNKKLVIKPKAKPNRVKNMKKEK